MKAMNIAAIRLCGALALAAVMMPGAAMADCDTPAGVAGEQFYNTSYNLMQYCNGTNWVNMGAGAGSAGNGDVTGPGSSTDNAIARFDGTTGKTIQSSSVTIDDSNNISGVATLNATTFAGSGASLTALNASNLSSGTVGTARLGSGTADGTTFLRGDGSWATPTGSMDGPGSSTDNAVVRWDGTGGDITQNSTVTIDDSGNVTATSFAGSGASLTALNASNLASGTVGTARLGSGTASSSTYLRGDGIWTTPSGSGDVVGPASSTDNTLVRFDSTTGKLLQGSGITVDDSSNVTGVGTIGVSNTATFSKSVYVSGQAAFSDFWGTTSGPWFGTPYGYIGSNGAYRLSLMWNGYRNASSGWTSLGVNSYTSAAGIEIGYDGIRFLGDSSAPSGTSPTLLMSISNTGAYVGIGTTPNSSYSLATAGNLLTTGYYHSSDARLKHDVTGFERDPIETVKGLRAVHFKWNKDNSDDFGVIAQEVEKVLPEAITRDEKGFMAVQYDKLVLPVIEAVKQMAARMSGYDARFAALEERLAGLEAANENLRAENASLRGAHAGAKAKLIRTSNP
ncbi:MAG: hypothetical protein GC131_02340 [Alphaproteobacteria bacterium]|nr:hypothetical protein [Alphaproteobacteria bacterium]